MIDNTKPFFSIIIPTYNRAAIIGKTLKSFINQTYKNFEIIVVDDGGTDDTKKVIENLKDNRIKYYWKVNGERGAARNYGAEKSKGEWLNFFDSDDIAYVHHLEEGRKVIKRQMEIKIFSFGQEMKNDEGIVLSKTPPSPLNGNERILKLNFVNPNCVFLRKEVWEEVKFNEDRKVTVSEDWLFHLQIAARYKFFTFDSIISNYMIQHSERSMMNATGECTFKRSLVLFDYLEKDEVFMLKSGNKLNNIKAEMYSLSALYFALEKFRFKALKALIIALFNKPVFFFSRRVLAVIKHLII